MTSGKLLSLVPAAYNGVSRTNDCAMKITQMTGRMLGVEYTCRRLKTTLLCKNRRERPRHMWSADATLTPPAHGGERVNY